MKFFGFDYFEFTGAKHLIARSGWSKQGGYEIYVEDTKSGLALYDKLFELGKEFNVRFNFTLYNPWMNFYKRGDHQEVHGHPTHLSGVFIANDGEEFSQFYFLDKDNYSASISPSLGKILNYGGAHNVQLKAGDIMFFPGYMLHGVSPHKSDIIRKTLSFNLDIKNVENQ